VKSAGDLKNSVFVRENVMDVISWIVKGGRRCVDVMSEVMVNSGNWNGGV
jgi:hypothetical protein